MLESAKSPLTLIRSLPALALACLAFQVCALAEQVTPAEKPRHITVPFRTLVPGKWAPDGRSFNLEIEDDLLGKLLLTLRIARVSETAYTLAADGTDYEVSYPLPAETSGGILVRAKKSALGEPLDAQNGETFVRWCIGARYFRFAQEELNGLPALPAERRAELAGLILEGRARALLELARDLSRLGRFNDAGRVIADAQAMLAAPDADVPAMEKIKALEQEAREFKVMLSAEAQALAAWQDQAGKLKQALEGAQGGESALIERLRQDLDGPLSAARRNAILKALHVGTRSGVNYSQGLDALKEFSFAVRYGEVLKREGVLQLDDFFAAEAAIHAYLDAPDQEAAAKLELALGFRGLTDAAFEALVRYGRRVGPPPAAADGAAPQGPCVLQAPVDPDQLEVAVEYRVMLPEDYHPSQRRPLLLALHGMRADAQAALQLWAPEALKHGWIVAALECTLGREKGYLSTPEERGMALRCIADCTRRFAIDPNRVFLAGHSMGGHMTWDVALTYPDRFAAAAPFIGCVNGISGNYVTNSLHVPIYCVSGEKDTAITKINRLVHAELQRQKRPIVYVEVPRRGHEGFQDELPRLFTWLQEQRRPRAPKFVDFVSGDVETSQVFWLAMLEKAKAQNLKAELIQEPDLLTAFRAQGLARLTATVSPENVVEIKAYRVPRVRLYLAQELFDFKKPLRVTLNGRVGKPLPIEATRKRMLEIARQSGDRERLYGCSVDLPVPK